MAVNITLTSSMRSNLSSLKSLASQMSTTQVRLSTGKKVNSAIDNADSYYQSRALTNRASDLDMLLDSMGQSIQTITSAVKGLESSGEILENAAVIAKQAYEAEKNIEVPATKEYFAELVGENGAVVSTAQELKDAIAANKKTICVYGKVDYFENETLTMKAGQKLVGTEYFTGYTGNKKFSEINFKGAQNNAIKTAYNTLISDLCINHQSYTTEASQVINVRSTGNKIANLDINHNILSNVNYAVQGSICTNENSILVINGVVNITKNNQRGAFGLWTNSRIDVAADAVVNVKGATTIANSIYYNSKFNIYGEVNASVTDGITIQHGSQFNIYDGGKFNQLTKTSAVVSTEGDSYVNRMYMADGALANFKDSHGEISLLGKGETHIFPSIGFRKLYTNNLATYSEFDSAPCDIDWSTWNPIPERGDVEEPTRVVYDKEQFDTTLTSFDEMIADSSYQGVNLLKGGKLTTMFNEDRTHSYTIDGKDMSLSGLGITTREWQTKDDIAASIKEIQNATSSIRDEVARLGNNLSIIETRMNFTDGLVDVLQTGADDLVLADMNEESANYLALQTRNNLAVNALALAAQSNNAVLKLF